MKRDDCLIKTQVFANVKTEVKGLTLARCCKLKRNPKEEDNKEQ